MEIKNIHLSEDAKRMLIRLKSRTGIKNWNVICRWALCLSLKESKKPTIKEISLDSNVEMTWKTFSGGNGDLYLALLKTRCIQDNIKLTDENVYRQLILHLHRGIGYLATSKEIKSITNLIQLVELPTST